jgi:hypothetical protein
MDSDKGDEPPEGPDDKRPGAAPIPNSWRAFLLRMLGGSARSSDEAKERSEDTEPPALTDEEIRAKVMRIDPTERKIGYLGAALGAIIALARTVPALVNPKSALTAPTKSTSKNCGFTMAYEVIHHVGYCRTVLESRGYWFVSLLILLAFPLAIFIAVRFGRRSPVAYAFLMTGLALEVTVGLFGLPFLFAGGWLLIRAWKSQKYGSPTAKRGDPPLAKTSSSRATSSTRTTKAGGSKKAKKGEPETTKRTPEASKRYTPKTPTKKKIAPPSN